MALTFKNLQDKVLAWLDETDDSAVVLGNVKEAIAAANVVRAGDREWPFMLTSGTITMTTATTYSLPSDFASLESIYNTTRERGLTQVPRRHAAPGYQHDYAFKRTGTSIELLYTPIVGDVLTVSYYRQPTELSGDDDVPDLPYPHSRVLIYDALLDLALYSEDVNPAKVQRWVGLQQKMEFALYGAYLDANSLNQSGNFPVEPDGDDGDGA